MLTNFQELAERTILSQYSNSKHIKGLIYAYKNAIDPTGEIQQFYDKIFNFETAESYGLNIWGIIVAANRYIDAVTGKFFGYYSEDNDVPYVEESYKGMYPYDQAPFYYDPGKTPLMELETEAWRTLIKLKMIINISDSTLPALNRYVKLLFEHNKCYATNYGPMCVAFTIYNSNESRMALFRAYTPYVVGAGVKIIYRIVGESSHFGFRGSDGLPFGQAPFVYEQTTYQDL